MSFFTAFQDLPENVRFAEQETDERIELLLRQHFIVNLPWILISIIGYSLPFWLVPLDSRLGFNFITSLPQGIIFGIIIIWFLLVTAFVIENYLHWYFNVYIVTNIHLVDINFHSLLSREITENRLEDIQSASSKIQGIIGSLFNFGDVYIETSAERQRVEFLKVPKPDFVADRIQDLQRVQEAQP